MKKQTKILIAAVIIIALAISAYFTVQQTQFGGGITVLSMSPTSVISSNSNLQGIWWLINAKTNGGQSLSGTLNPTDARTIDGGYLTKNPLSITVSAVNENINYNIVNTGNPVYKYSMYVTKSPRDCENMAAFGSTNAPACNAGDSSDPTYTGGLIFGWFNYVCQRNCIHATQVGVLGNINPDNLVHQADITLSNGQQTITKRVTSASSSADFNGLAQVEYTNDLWTGNFAPSSANMKAFYNTYSTQQWKITSDQHVNEYVTQKQIFDDFLADLEIQVDTLVYPSGSTNAQKLAIINNFIQQKIDAVNAKEAVVESDDLSISSGQTWTNKGDLNSGKVVINTNTQIASMNLLFRVRADWLGIVIETGKPSILSTSACNFKSGDTQEIKITVKNSGSTSGSFKAGITCPNIKQTYNTVASQFAAGETKDLIVTLDANNKAALTEACQVSVFDTNLASNSAQTSFTCKVTAPAECQVGDFSVVGNCVKGCDSVSGTVVQKFCCNSGETILRDLNNITGPNGGYYCHAEGNGTVPPLSCNAWYQVQGVQVTSVKSWYNYIGLGSPTIVQTPVCQTAGWVYFAEFLIFAGVIAGGLIFYAYSTRKKSPSKRR